MDFRDDITGEMPDHLRDKLDWAGAYSDDGTGDQTYCNAAWSADASASDCAEADAIFSELYPDAARVNHTGHCPGDLCGNPQWAEGADRIAPGSG